MGVFLSIGLVTCLWILVKVINVFSKKPKPLPTIDVNKNWGNGPSDSVVDPELIETFALDFDKSSLIESLRITLENGCIRPAQPLDGIGFEYGVNSDGFKHFLDYWANNYLSRLSERQKYLNKFPQFTTEVQGYNCYKIT